MMEFNSECIPIIEGEQGSVSSSVIQPQFMPDKFESGTMNAPAIAGLLAGIKFYKLRRYKHNKRACEEYLTE